MQHAARPNADLHRPCTLVQDLELGVFGHQRQHLCSGPCSRPRAVLGWCSGPGCHCRGSAGWHHASQPRASTARFVTYKLHVSHCWITCLSDFAMNAMTICYLAHITVIPIRQSQKRFSSYIKCACLYVIQVSFTLLK